MVIVQEEEKFWSMEDWEKILKEYYNPLINANAITNFKYEIVPDDNWVAVRRTFFDWRDRDLYQGTPQLKEPLPQQLKIDVQVDTRGGQAEDALYFIQNYKKYWPDTLHMDSYVISQGRSISPCTTFILSNYEEEEEKEEEEENNVEEVY